MEQDDIDQLVQQVKDAMAERRFPLALSQLDQLAAELPQNAHVPLWRGECLAEMGKFAEAIAEARLAAELDPELAGPHVMIARCSLQLNRAMQAQQEYVLALKLDPDPALLAEYAYFMALYRGPRLAEEAALKAIRADDRNPQAWTSLGIAQIRLHQHVAARDSLQQALKIDFEYVPAKRQLAVLLQHMGEEGKAAALVKLLDDDSATTQWMVQHIQAEQKEKLVARKLLEREEVQKEIFKDPERPFRKWLWIIMAVFLAAGGLMAFATGRWMFTAVVPVSAVAYLLTRMSND